MFTSLSAVCDSLVYLFSQAVTDPGFSNDKGAGAWRRAETETPPGTGGVSYFSTTTDCVKMLYLKSTAITMTVAIEDVWRMEMAASVDPVGLID